MSISPVDPKGKQIVLDILSHFAHAYDTMDGPFADHVGKICGKYPVSMMSHNALKAMLSKYDDVTMKSNNLFLWLRPTREQIVPLMTLESSANWVHFRIYVLITMLDADSALQALALRFETDEGYPDGKIGAHDFCHMQLCRSINQTVRDLSPPWLPETQPSVPLDADDQISLVLCMLVALYGGREVVATLSGPGTGSLLQPHLQRVRALRAPAHHQRK